MSDYPAQLRIKAEACRRLAEITTDASRRVHWLRRADDWEALANKAQRELRATAGRATARAKDNLKQCRPLDKKAPRAQRG